MGLRNGKPIRWSPTSVTDSADGTNAEKGAMAGLINLVSDPTTARCLVPRPASIELTNFTGFTAPGFVSCLYVTNNLAYGMIAGTAGGFAGHDIPFVYDLVNEVFITVSGITFANTPTSAPSTGPWTPPTMAIISTKVMTTHPGFAGSANVIGWIDISTPAAPVWQAGNTTTNTLPSVPTSVANFNNRAYYAIGNMLYFSDSLIPTQMTNASQAITLGDTSPIVAQSGTPLTSTTVGGAIQALIVFKNNLIYQVTGDFAFTPGSSGALTLSAIDVAVGTFSPLSVTPTPQGLAFIAPDGLRFVLTTAQVTDAVGIEGDGVAIPFINATYPSRTAAAYNEGVLRISTITNYNPISQFFAGGPTNAVEYWFEISKKKWLGPHTFPFSLVQAYNNTFVTTPISVSNSLWQSDVIPNVNSVYSTESGSLNTWNYITSLLPETSEMALNALIEATIGIAPGQNTGGYNVTILDQNYNDITPNGPVTITPVVSTTIWGSFLWGVGKWGGGSLGITQYQIPLTQPVVFKQCYVLISGTAAYGQRIDNLDMRYQPLGYLTDGKL